MGSLLLRINIDEQIGGSESVVKYDDKYDDVVKYDDKNHINPQHTPYKE